MLLLAVFAGVVARAMPTSWHWPERIASSMLDMPMWNAGLRLAGVADPGGWRVIVVSTKIVRDNADTIVACRKSAAKAKKPVRCTIKVKAGG
jgi:hypothetical protein